MALELCGACGGNGTTDRNGICRKCGGFGFALEAKPITREEKIFGIKRSAVSFEDFRNKLARMCGEVFATTYAHDLWGPKRMIV